MIKPNPTQVVTRRCAGYALDLLLVEGGAVLLGGSAAVGLVILRGRAGNPAWLSHAPTVLFVAVLIAVSLCNDVLLVHRRGATVGVWVAGVRVVTEQGARPTVRMCALRWVLWVVDGLLFGLVGLGVVLCTRYHQRLGDVVARTYVVRDRSGDGSPSGPRSGSRLSVDDAALPGPDGDLGAVARADLPLGLREMDLDHGQ